MSRCELCQEYGFVFDRNYMPVAFIEGKKKTSKIWIVGLNPKPFQTGVDERYIDELENFFLTGKTQSYFKDFDKVSKRLYDLLGAECGVCHTDIVKCSSKSFPPKNLKKDGIMTVTNNCSGYFVEQLRLWKPKLIICNGSPTCEIIKKIIKPPKEVGTSYTGDFEGNRIYVVLSGFIGRIDNYAKRRLGNEIERYLHLIMD
jgi:uracil-DNA glycosylase